MNEFDKAQIILNERNGLRQEQIFLQRAVQRCILAFLLAFVGILGTYFSKEIIPQIHKSVLFLSLSQIEVLLFLLISSLSSAAYIHGGYIAALEYKLNEFADDNINLWESEICPNYFMKPSSPFFFTCICQAIGYILIFGVLIYLSYEVTNHILWGIVLTIEVLIILSLFIWSLCIRKKVESFAKEKFKTKREERG